MKKVELVKKLVLSVLVILYGIVSFLWCYVLFASLIFEFCTVRIGLKGINIIGAADIPALMFKEGNVLLILEILFVFLNIATVVLLTVSMFKKQTSPKLHILLCVFTVLSLIIFIIIPTQTYVIAFYLLIKRLSFLKHLHIFYIILSLVVIVENVSIVVKRRSWEK